MATLKSVFSKTIVKYFLNRGSFASCEPDGMEETREEARRAFKKAAIFELCLLICVL